MEKVYLINLIDKLEIKFGFILANLSKYPAINLKVEINNILQDIKKIYLSIQEDKAYLDIRNVKKLEELFLNLNSKAYDEDKSFIKAGHILACYFFDTYPSIIDVLLEIEKNKNIVNFLEIHEYLEFLAKYVILCGRYINDIFSINDIFIK